jgi:hypothetical protein
LVVDRILTIKERLFLSFRRKPESRDAKKFWTPAFAGVTAWGAFYETGMVEPVTISRTYSIPLTQSEESL